MSYHLTNINKTVYGTKLSHNDVYVILELYFRFNWTQNNLAKEFNVTKETIRKIVNGKSRKDCFYLYKYQRDTHIPQLDDLVKKHIK